MNIEKFVKEFIERGRNLYEAQGIVEILKKEYGIHFGKGYVFYLLEAMKDKRVMPEEAEDSLLILKCKEEFGD